MKDNINQYVDSLFSDIHETKQLRELKEEISANLLEKIHDLIARGDNAETAFKNAVSNLGDMSELVGSLKKASEAKLNENMFKPMIIDKEHVIGYVAASICLLLGVMVGGFIYLQQQELTTALTYLSPFILVAAPLFIYFGLTQETQHDYGMSSKRALSYSIASELLLIGVVISGIEYVHGQQPSFILLTLMPFVVIAAILFIYLGLTEKSRRKMDSEWQKEWINYYSDPQSAMVRGGISGALWIFSIAAFFYIGFTAGWKYSWIVLVVAVGCEPLIEAYFASKRKNKNKSYH